MNKSTRTFVVGVAVGFAACYVYQNYMDTARVNRTS